MPTYQIDGATFQSNSELSPDELNQLAGTGNSTQNNTVNDFQQASSALDSLLPKQSDNQQPPSINGLNAVGLETGRGLQSGTGQLIADAGWVVNGAGMFKNGIGNAINQYGKDMMTGAAALPETDLPGIVKGVANIAGQAAPMLATFGAGEAAGLAKIGELATNAVGTMTNIRSAKYFSTATRAMGQGTLFGVVNAIDTASTMPENTNMKEQINAIMDSGKSGFIAGATLTPLLEVGSKVLSKYGEKALRAYTVGITGSEKAADAVYDLTRTPGTYESVMKVDPNAPEGQRITLQLSKAADVTKEAQASQHEQMAAQLDTQLTGIRDTHEEMKQKLTDEISAQRQQFESDQRAISQQIDASLSDIKLQKNEAINQNNAKALNESAIALQHGIVGNSHNLQIATQAFDGTIESSLNLTNTAKEKLYDSVIKTAPADGFSAQAIIAKIRNMMQKEYGVNFSKELPKRDVGIRLPGSDPRGSSTAINPQLAEAMDIKPKWTANSRAAGGQVNSNALKVSKYLTDTLLPDLEEKIKTNNGVYTVDMLRETTKNIKALGYEDGIKNPEFASLDRVFRANRNLGEIIGEDGQLNLTDKGIFIGSDTSLAAMKQAAILDDKFYQTKMLADEYASSIRGSVESKAKAFGKDLQTTETLSKLEAALDLPADSKLRLSNNMKSYYDSNNSLLAQHEKNSYLLGEKLRIQQNALNDEIAAQKFSRTEERIGAKQSEQSKVIEARRTAIVNKDMEIRKFQEFKDTYTKAIEKEKFDREAALNEIRAVGRGDTPLGRIQRGFITGSGWGLLYGHIGASLPAATAAAVLSPKAGIPIIRSILKSSRTGVLSKVNRGLEGISQRKLLRQLIIGSSLRKNTQSLQKK